MHDQVDSGVSGSVADREVSICWRQLDARLWAGRALDRPVGTIERSRDFVFIDLDGNEYGGHSSLAGAQAVAEHSNEAWPAPPRAHWFLTSFASAAALAGLGAALLAVVLAIVAQGMSLWMGDSRTSDGSPALVLT